MVPTQHPTTSKFIMPKIILKQKQQLEENKKILTSSAKNVNNNCITNMLKVYNELKSTEELVIHKYIFDKYFFKLEHIANKECLDFLKEFNIIPNPEEKHSAILSDRSLEILLAKIKTKSEKSSEKIEENLKYIKKLQINNKNFPEEFIALATFRILNNRIVSKVHKFQEFILEEFPELKIRIKTEKK